jgi:hypothetical protein
VTLALCILLLSIVLVDILLSPASCVLLRLVFVQR